MSIAVQLIEYCIVAVLVTGCALLLLNVVHRKPDLFWKGTMWVLGVGTALDLATQPRSVINVVDTSNADWIARGLFSIVVFLGIIAIGYRLVVKQIPKKGFFLWIGAFFFNLSLVVTALYGTVPITALNSEILFFSKGILILPCLFSAIYLLPKPGFGVITRTIKNTLLVCYIYPSLIGAIVAPSWALELQYTGIIPGLTLRLNGISTQANGLAPLALLYLIMDMLDPSPKMTARLNRIFAFLVLILTQSKTAIVTLLIIILIRGYYHLSNSRYGRTIKGKILKFTLMLTLVFITFIGTYQVYNSGSLNSEQAASLMTLTGRTTIWQDTIEVWKLNPVFGYGLTLWDQDMRDEWNIPYAGQAHNQFVQTLGETGVIGEITLVVYLLIMAIVSIRCYRSTKGVSLYLIIYLLFRMISEVPLTNLGVNSNFYSHFIIFTIFILATNREEREEIFFDGEKVSGLVNLPQS